MLNKLIILELLLIQIVTSDLMGQPTALTPAAQEAINNGIIATKVPDYLLAVHYFEEARKAAPQAPEVFFNLGLAESKIPGRELRAICWFGAFLTANPDAANATGVKEQMKILFIKNQSNLSRLIKSVQDAAGLLSSSNMLEVAALWVKNDEIETAQKVVAQSGSEFSKRQIQYEIAIRLANKGDVNGALKAINHIEKVNINNDVFVAIVSAFLAQGDLISAQNTRLLISPDNSLYSPSLMKLVKEIAESGKITDAIAIAGKYDGALNEIVKVQANNGDIMGAKLTANMIVDDYYKDYALAEIITTQANSGDIAGAQNNASLIKQRPSSQLSVASLEIVKAQAKVGDVKSAEMTMNIIIHGDTKCKGFVAIAEAKILHGDTAGAKISLSNAQNSLDKLDKDRISFERLTELKDLISNVRIKLGLTGINISNSKDQPEPFIKLPKNIAKWITLLDETNFGNVDDNIPLNSELFLNLINYLKSIPASEPDKYFNELKNTADKLVKAQIIIEKMMREIK